MGNLKMKRRTTLKSLLGATGLATGIFNTVTENALADSAYPNKPIKYIVPVSAGGGSDMIGRTVCERWGRALGQAIIVDNEGGGGGVIACQNTAKAAPDGYTLMQGYVATLGTSPATRKNLPYDPIKDFTPIGMIGGTPNVLVVHPSVPAKNLKEFIDYIKKNPSQVSYGSSGQGSLTHLTMELFKQVEDSPIVHIPYKGIAPAFNDLMGGQIQAMFPGLAAALPHIRSGRVRAIAVTGTTRSSQLKDIPTLEELGFKGFTALQWYGVVGPAGMPAPIVRRLNETLRIALSAPELKDKMSVEAVEPMATTPEQFAQYIKADLARWTKLAKERNIELDN
jgi:tripartite-type tricarboxylate transporter receptor subunit TctC